MEINAVKFGLLDITRLSNSNTQVGLPTDDQGRQKSDIDQGGNLPVSPLMKEL